MSFEGLIQEISNSLQIIKSDRELYVKDMESIVNYVMNEVKSLNSFFKESFDGMLHTGTYLDRIRIKTPDEFDFLIKLKVGDIKLKPIHSPDLNGYLKLSLGGNCDHRFSKADGFISVPIVQYWLRLWLEGVFESKPLKHACNGRTYELKYTNHIIALAHTIKATDVVNRDHCISIDFVPVFEIDGNDWPYAKGNLMGRTWFAVAVAGRESNRDDHFKVCVPHWEREILFDKVHLKDALRLMKAMRDTQELNKLSSNMLNNVFMYEVERSPGELWNRPVGEIIITMLEHLLVYFANNKLPFYWQPSIDLFDRMDAKSQYDYKVKLQSVLQMLKRARMANAQINRREIQGIFV